MALILSRKLGERILLDGGIEIQVVKVQGNKIRLGITAPKDCKVIRAELQGKEKKNGSA
jgi:carbon storage regulator